MGDGSGWTPKDGKTKTEVEICYTDRHVQDVVSVLLLPGCSTH